MTTVLLVEDDQKDASLALRALGRPQGKACSVHHVRRVQDAMRYLRRHRSVDVVLSDISLPDGRGLETLAMIRGVTADVPVVFMTTLDDTALAVDAVGQGAQDYLVKDDCSEDSLLRVVRYAAEHKQCQEQVQAAKAKAKALRSQTRRLRQEQEQLKLTSKAKDDFISLASHQLRTPATGVKQYIGMVLEGFAGEVPEQLRPFLAQAYESNERQLAIVNDLLQVAQLDAGTLHLRRQPCDIGRLLLSIVSEQAAKFSQRRQRLAYRPPQAAVIAEADPERMRMVFDNLIDNASKYTPDGRTVTVVIGQAHGMVAVSVRDEGVGIAPEDVAKVFEKFNRVANPRSDLAGGTGLGLYWAKRIVDLHDGGITVLSEVGRGSEFIVRLPVGQPSQAADGGLPKQAVGA